MELDTDTNKRKRESSESYERESYEREPYERERELSPSEPSDLSELSERELERKLEERLEESSMKRRADARKETDIHDIDTGVIRTIHGFLKGERTQEGPLNRLDQKLHDNPILALSTGPSENLSETLILQNFAKKRPSTSFRLLQISIDGKYYPIDNEANRDYFDTISRDLTTAHSNIRNYYNKPANELYRHRYDEVDISKIQPRDKVISKKGNTYIVLRVYTNNTVLVKKGDIEPYDLDSYNSDKYDYDVFTTDHQFIDDINTSGKIIVHDYYIKPIEIIQTVYQRQTPDKSVAYHNRFDVKETQYYDKVRVTDSPFNATHLSRSSYDDVDSDSDSDSDIEIGGKRMTYKRNNRYKRTKNRYKRTKNRYKRTKNRYRIKSKKRYI